MAYQSNRSGSKLAFCGRQKLFSSGQHESLRCQFPLLYEMVSSNSSNQMSKSLQTTGTWEMASKRVKECLTQGLARKFRRSHVVPIAVLRLERSRDESCVSRCVQVNGSSSERSKMNGYLCKQDVRADN